MLSTLHRIDPYGTYCLRVLSRMSQILPGVHGLLQQLTVDCAKLASWTKLVAPGVDEDPNECKRFAVVICRQLRMMRDGWATRLNNYALERSRHEANVCLWESDNDNRK